ncbi:hypothetical protein AB5N19_02691 [Seiridium cardinale]|uniref:Clr5 domain-containing protein n=1 Tax=Seiridium cardinale TaxID=138064 RepID=A0ABR2XVT9_9PEZI
MESVYSIPIESDLHELLSRSSGAIADPTWPSPYSFSSEELTFDEPYTHQIGFSVDDMMLDVFNADLDLDDMDWTASRSEPDMSTTINRRRRANNKRPTALADMQSKFSTGRKTYIAPQTAETWESQKTELHRLYIHEDKTLKEIMGIMEPKGFKASAKMYKTRFKQWGFAKNNTREEVVKMIQVRRQRAAVGKPTTFERNGRIVKIDTYMRKNGIVICDLSKPTSPDELPNTVRCHTPPPEALPTSGPLLLKELLIKCLQNLIPSFSRIKRPADGKFTATTELWDAPRYLKLACDLFSEKRNKQAGSICNSAFASVHALVTPPRLDTLFNFLVSQLWWANRDITLELWRYLAAYMSNVLHIQDEVYHFLRTLVDYIETHGYESYLDFITECIDDILILNGATETLIWRTDNQLVGWCQLIVMDCYFLNGHNPRAKRIQARCTQALPRGSLFPHDRDMNEQMWRETFGRHVWSGAPKSKSARHANFLRLALITYAKVLGRMKGSPVMHPSLTRIEGVVGSLSRKHLDPSAITKHQRSFNLERRIMSFLTRDVSQGTGKPVDYGSYPM